MLFHATRGGYSPVPPEALRPELLPTHPVCLSVSPCRAPATRPTDAPCRPPPISPTRRTSARGRGRCRRRRGTRCPGTCPNTSGPSGRSRAARCWTPPSGPCCASPVRRGRGRRGRGRPGPEGSPFLVFQSAAPPGGD